MARCAGKVAIVTGAASGIGWAVAQLLAAEGAKVLLTDINAEKGKLAANDIGKAARFHKHDSSKESDWQAVIDYCLASFGQLDILVNNAGVAFAKEQQTPSEITTEEWRGVNAVNTEGVMLGCKHAISAMQASGGGAIVNVSSVAARMASPLAYAYGASKAAVAQLTKTVSYFCATEGLNIRCNALLPGIVDTALYRTFPEKHRTKSVRAVPVGRPGTPDEVAQAVLFLASDESSYITGIELPVDGGLLAGNLMRAHDWFFDRSH